MSTDTSAAGDGESTTEAQLRARIEELEGMVVDLQADDEQKQMTIELMEYDEADFYDDVTVDVGATTALQHRAESDIQLLV